MKQFALQFARYLIIAAGLAMIGLLLTLTNAGHSVAQTLLHVIVDNTTANPAKTTLVSGGLVVGNTVALDPANNTVKFNASTTQAISNANNSLNGKTVVYVMSSNDAMQPYVAAASVSVPPGLNSGSASFSTAVPAGKRLVIENVSGVVGILKGTHISVIRLDAATSVQGGPTFNRGYFLQPALIGQFQSTMDIYQFNHSVRIYADPGTVPSLTLLLAEAAGGSEFFNATISGYLVDLP